MQLVIRLIYCLFLIWTASAYAKTVAINIAFDFQAIDQEAKNQQGFLQGVSKDMEQYKKLVKQAKINDVINVTEEDYRKFPSKQEFLQFLKSKIEPGDRVLLNYSGHGMTAPRNSSVKLNSPSEINAENSELVFADRRFYDCTKSSAKPKADPGFKSTYKTCYQGGYDKVEALSMDCQKDKKKNWKNCVDAFTTDLILSSGCELLAFNSIGLGFGSSEYFFSRFYKDSNNCFEKFALLSSDFEDLLKENKVLIHVDACMSGVLSGFKNDSVIIGASSGTLELSNDSAAGGVFTNSKEIELQVNPCAYDKNSDGKITLTEWYSHSPDSFLMSRNRPAAPSTSKKDKTTQELLNERFMNSILVVKNISEEDNEPTIVESYNSANCKTLKQTAIEHRDRKSKTNTKRTSQAGKK